MRTGIMGMAMLAWAACAGAQTLGNGMVVIVEGPPGSGKTTQAEMLGKEFRIPSISGPVAVKKQQGWRKRSKSMRDAVAAGTLLSEEATTELVIEYIKRQDYRKGFVLDGFPATVAQAEALGRFAKEMHLEPPVTVVLEVPDDVVRQRMAARKRADDTPQNIEKKLAEYHAEVKALRAVYPEARVKRVDGAKPQKAVYEEIKGRLGAR